MEIQFVEDVTGVALAFRLPRCEIHAQAMTTAPIPYARRGRRTRIAQVLPGRHAFWQHYGVRQSNNEHGR
jgi:hypothetical protein